MNSTFPYTTAVALDSGAKKFIITKRSYWCDNTCNATATRTLAKRGLAIIGTARIVCRVGSMKRYGVRPSVCLSQHGPTAANPLLQVCWCRLGGQEMSIDCRSSGVWRANAGSASLSTYVDSWTRRSRDLRLIGIALSVGDNISKNFIKQINSDFAVLFVVCRRPSNRVTCTPKFWSFPYNNVCHLVTLDVCLEVSVMHRSDVCLSVWPIGHILKVTHQRQRRRGQRTFR